MKTVVGLFLGLIVPILLSPSPTHCLVPELSQKSSSYLASSCSDEIKCQSNPKGMEGPPGGILGPDVFQCTSHFGGFPELSKHAQVLVGKHLEISMKYLLLSSRFDFWKTQRKGFYSYLQKLSDDTWDDGVRLLEQLAKRGGTLNDSFALDMPENVDYHLTEIEALSKALDFEKELASGTEELMHSAFHGSPEIPQLRGPDPTFAHFLAEKINVKHVDRVHELASHVRNLGSAMSGTTRAGVAPTDLSLILYLYDTQFME